MARVLGINAVFHDPSAALVVDGRTVAAAEEERFTRRKHGKQPVAFSTWELPTEAARWCLEEAGVEPGQLDAVGYSYDPTLASWDEDITAEQWEPLRTLFAQRAPLLLRAALPGLEPRVVRFVPHHVAHAASAYLAAPFDESAVMVLDGRGERISFLAGHARAGDLNVLRRVALPDSLGLMYESATEHLGFRRSSDEYKVMALAAYGSPRHAPSLREAIHARAGGVFRTRPVEWAAYCPPGEGERQTSWGDAHADLAASVQHLLEEIELDLSCWLQSETGARTLTMAGGVALNCVANSRIWRDGPFDDVWVQPAAGDAGTALGAALYLAHELGDAITPFTTAALGRGFTDDELARQLDQAAVAYRTPDSIAADTAHVLAAGGVVGWFQGRSEWGPRALGHRSLLASPCDGGMSERLNDIKGREQFRPVAPIVLAERAGEIFEGPLPSPYMLFTHHVRREWQSRIPAVVHVDGSARVQTVDRRDEPLLADLLDEFERSTGVPVLVNTSFNTRGRPIVDSPVDALECFGASPIDALAIGPHLVERPRRPRPQ